MSFADALKRLNDVVMNWQPGEQAETSRVRRQDLRELLHHFHRLDDEARARHHAQYDPSPKGQTAELSEDERPRYSMRRVRDELARAKEYARREALEEAAQAHAKLLTAGKHLAVKLAEVYRAAGQKPADCQAIRDWVAAIAEPPAGSQETGPDECQEQEKICTQAAMAQWEASLKRPDLDEKDRVYGAIAAYKRQAFVFNVCQTHQTATAPLTKTQIETLANNIHNNDDLTYTIQCLTYHFGVRSPTSNRGEVS